MPSKDLTLPIASFCASLCCAVAASLALLGGCSSGSSPAAHPDASTDARMPDEGGQDGESDATSDTTDTSDAGDGDAALPGDAFGGPYLVFPPLQEPPYPPTYEPKRVVTITFQGDPMAPQLQAFGQGVASSAWWGTVFADYCGGPPCNAPPGISDVIAAAPGPAYVDSNYNQFPDGGVPVASVIQGEIAQGHVPPPGDTPTLYVLYLPSTTSVNYDGSLSCVNFAGYHNWWSYLVDPDAAATSAMGAGFYAVVMECPQQTIDAVTTTASHEVVEAATDFVSYGTPYGYALDFNDLNTWGWDMVLGPEVGDLCEDPLGLHQSRYSDGTFTYQRIWSKSAAAALDDPCVPVPTGVTYFNAYPQEAFFELDVGETRTFTVAGFSTATRPDWYVNVAEDFAASQPGTTPFLSFTMSGSTINNYETLQVKMTLLADPTFATYDGYTVAKLTSTDTPTIAAATVGHIWPFVVMSRATAQDAGINEPGQLARAHGNRAHRPARGSGMKVAWP
jgi:hypothetical protein